MLVTILNHCEKENFVCMCVIEDHDESIDVDLTSHPKKTLQKRVTWNSMELAVHLLHMPSFLN